MDHIAQNNWKDIQRRETKEKDEDKSCPWKSYLKLWGMFDDIAYFFVIFFKIVI